MAEGCFTTVWALLVIFCFSVGDCENGVMDIPNYRVKSREGTETDKLVLTNPGSLEDLNHLLADSDLDANGVRSSLDEEDVNWKTLSNKEQKSLMNMLKSMVTMVGNGESQMPNSSMHHMVKMLFAKVALLELGLNNQTNQTTSALKELKASCSKVVSGMKETKELISSLKLKMEASEAETKTNMKRIKVMMNNGLDAQMKDMVAMGKMMEEIEKTSHREFERQRNELRAQTAMRPNIGVHRRVADQKLLREGDRCSVLDQQRVMLYSMWRQLNSTPDKGTVKVRKATSSSVGWAGIASRAVDGNKNPRWAGRSCTHTTTEMKPWLLLKLQGISDVTGVELTNRGDCCDRRLSNFVIETYMDNPTTSPDAKSTECFHYTGTVGRAATVLIKCKFTIQALYVKITRVETTPSILTICEAVVKGQLIGLASAKQAIQSSIESDQTGPEMANDGDKSTCSQTMLDSLDSTPWWQIDLGKVVTVHKVFIRNRNDEKYVWLRNITVTVYKEFPSICADVTPHLCTTFANSVGQGQVVTLICQKPINGRYLKIRLNKNSVSGALSLCEVSVNDDSMLFG
ncbi:uncharacterized protein [Haliotis asinina]|uniref:uncharacterized protein n=1 Tax=Haliotis asinina TaxID=109174 RepID=UPI0035320875